MIGREPVCSMWYGRWQEVMLKLGLLNTTSWVNQSPDLTFLPTDGAGVNWHSPSCLKMAKSVTGAWSVAGGTLASWPGRLFPSCSSWMDFDDPCCKAWDLDFAQKCLAGADRKAVPVRHCQSILTWHRDLPWSPRWFPQGEAAPLHYGVADPCDYPKCG